MRVVAVIYETVYSQKDEIKKQIKKIKQRRSSSKGGSRFVRV